MPHFLVGLDDCTGLQGLRLHFQIHFGVAVGRLQGDMAEPGADGVDVDAGAEEVNGGGMALMPSSALAP